MEKTLVIGIAGGTGSGKTTLMRCLVERFGGQVTVLSHDNYYKRHDELSFEERCGINYDEPAAFDTSLLVYHLSELRRGAAIDCPVYDFTLHNRSDETIHVEARKVIIVEGILIFENQELRDLMDIRIFVDTDADIRLCRRIKRDVNKRGRSLESVLQQYQATVKPMHEKYVEPSRKYANLVVPEGGKNTVALDMITNHIQNYLDAL
ncbi:MAG: uridine kinase [Oscillospiraceae bacterium]|nr:uridine kinase [Oscillospiraceae bacterium]